MEQALVFASIIVGVAVSDQILSLNRLFRSTAPVRWHWATPLVALQVLMTNVQMWWGIAGDHQTAITIGEFLPSLFKLIVLALLSAASLPDHVSDDGIDLATYYRSSARYIWSLFALTLAWSEGTALIEALQAGGTVGAFVGSRVGDFIALGIMASLIFVRNWYLVAVGLAFLSIGPVHWLSRSLS